jgi:septum formation protein
MYDSLRQLAARYELILGSRSPRRVSLLEELRLPFTQIIPDLEEDRRLGEHPYDYARRLAEDKARLVGRNTTPQQIVLGCDTVVVMGDCVLGKPADTEEALRTLTALSGKKHVVCTALALARGETVLASGYELTTVVFNSVTAEQIRNYIATGEPMDKAGAYGIQGMGSFLVDSTEGNLDNVVGLPRTLLERLAGEVISR